MRCCGYTPPRRLWMHSVIFASMMYHLITHCLQLLQVVYSYWDGSGHRKAIEVRKGVTVGRFLEMVKQQLVADFSEVRSTSPEDLIYVKEDLIIPHVSVT